MDQEKESKLADFVLHQIRNAKDRAHDYAFDASDNKYPTRNCYLVLDKHIRKFRKKETDDRLTLLYGLRGAGKTTLLSQLYYNLPVAQERKLFISLDEVSGIIGATLQDVLEVYQEILECPFEKLTEPVFLFLDEIHFDSNWSLSLKTLYDKSKKVYVIATGSSALSLQALQASGDLSRRPLFEKLYPMSFTEYMKVRTDTLQRFEDRGLGKEIRTALFNSNNASDVYHHLKKLEMRVKKYWFGISKKEFERYMGYGTLPFTLTTQNEMKIYDQIKRTLEKVIHTDIPHINEFSSEITSKIPSVLYALASTDQFALNSFSDTTDISRPTLMSILDTLEKTEVIWRLHPYGSHHKQVRKPSKYLFTTPAFRSMYFNLIESTATNSAHKGAVFEDAVGLTLRRIFAEKNNVSITYDSSQNGSDFIVRYGKKTLVIEAGYGKKNIKQVTQTMKRVPPSCGIVVSESPLACYQQENVICVPFSYFFLI